MAADANRGSLDALVGALKRWREVAKQPRRERRPSAPRPAYYVIIDEPGMGYCSRAWNYEDAMRQANKLRSDGYRVIVKRPNVRISDPAP